VSWRVALHPATHPCNLTEMETFLSVHSLCRKDAASYHTSSKHMPLRFTQQVTATTLDYNIPALEPGLYNLRVTVRCTVNGRSEMSELQVVVKEKPQRVLENVTALAYSIPAKDESNTVAVISWGRTNQKAVELFEEEQMIQVVAEIEDPVTGWQVYRKRCINSVNVGNFILEDIPHDVETMRFCVSETRSDSFGILRGPEKYSANLKLGKHTHQEKQPEPCVICGDAIHNNDTDKARTPALPSKCSHLFHAECLLKWSQKKRACPLCCTSFDGVVCKATADMTFLYRTIEAALFEFLDKPENGYFTTDYLTPLLWDDDTREHDHMLVEIIYQTLLES